MVMSSEADVLIVGYPEERFAEEIRTAFRHWQVYSVANPFALENRPFRRAYVTAGAFNHRNWPHVDRVLASAARLYGCEVMAFSDYEPPGDESPDDDPELVRTIRRGRYPAN